MNILVITQLYPQPDDIGDNKPTHTVEYFARVWESEGHNVIIMHCPSKFPLVFYYIPTRIKNILGASTSNIIPSLASRKKLKREEFGITVYRLPMLKYFPGMGYSKQKIEIQVEKIEKLIKIHKFIPDLIAGHFANPSAELVARLTKKYPNAKSSIVFHNDCNRKNIKKYHISNYIKEIGAVGARSIIEAKSIKTLLNLNRQPFLCFSGVPDDAVKTAEKQCIKQDFSNGIKHIFVGSLIARKHLKSTIKAFIKRGTRSSTLEIIGGGPEEKKLKAMVAKNKANNMITFSGRIPRLNVLQRMKGAHIFTLISEGETYGMVYIEAMLQGCIVIASRGGGFDGIIQDRINGFICNPGDAEMLESIYQRIEDMTIDERNEMGQRAIDLAIHLSEKEVADNYLRDIFCYKNNNWKE